MQLRTLCWSLLLGVFSISLPFSCNAWEYEDAIPLPRANERTINGVNLERVSIALRGLSVSLDYAINNTTNKPFKGKFSIYLPPFSWSGVAAENADQHFPELQISSTRGAIALDRNVVALEGGRTVTGLLNAAGIDPLLVARREDAVLEPSAMRGKAAKQLLVSGIFDNVAGQLIPRWHTQVSYSWSQTFAAQSTDSIRVRYKARPEFGTTAYPSSELEALLGQHCATMADLNKALAAQKILESSSMAFQRIEIPFGLEQEGITKAFINSKMDGPIFGLTPSASFACSGNNEHPALIGTPSLDSSVIESPRRRISILVISAQ